MSTVYTDKSEIANWAGNGGQRPQVMYSAPVLVYVAFLYLLIMCRSTFEHENSTESQRRILFVDRVLRGKSAQR